MDIARFAVFKARTQEETPALVFAEGVATYGQLMRAVESALIEIDRLELPPESLVALNINNPFRHTVLLLALCLIGMPSASIMSSAHVEASGVTPALCITDKADFQLAGCRTLVLDDAWFLINPSTPISYEALLKRRGFNSKEQVARVVFSSGTTGIPKAVAMTAGVLESSLSHAELAQAGPHSHAFRILNMMGFSTVGSLIAILGALSHGGLIAFTFSAVDALRLIRAFQIEILGCAVGQLYGLIEANAGQSAPPSLKTLVAAGAKIPLPLLERSRARLCPNLTVMYGSTEAGPMTFGTGAALDFAEGSAGHLLPWVKMQVVDQDGVEVPNGQEGLIRIKSEDQSYYLSSNAETDVFFVDDWFYPGDVGKIYADGLVVITGRSSEVINRGGQIVAPETIETIVRDLPGIKDVAVFGAPGAAGLDEIWVAVVSDNWIDANMIKEVVGRKMPDRRPDHVAQVDSIPKNGMDKVMRAQLRDQTLAKAGEKA